MQPEVFLLDHIELIKELLWEREFPVSSKARFSETGVEADLWGMVQVDTHSPFHVMLLGDSLATAFL